MLCVENTEHTQPILHRIKTKSHHGTLLRETWWDLFYLIFWK